MKNINKIRSKYYTIELYNESENINFNDKIDLIKKYDYAFILHDKDNCKSHYHCVIIFNNYRYLNSVSEELNIPTNYIEEVRTIDGMLTYLIHLNDKSKFQYNINDIVGSEKAINMFYKAYKNNGLVEENKIIDLLHYIDTCGYLTLHKFIIYACSIGRYDIVRRSQYIFLKIIDEHNNSLL